MNEGTVMALMLLLVFLLFIFFFASRMIAKFSREKKRPEDKPMSEVGFVVDTFHELVSKLKEKERELEMLKSRAEDRASSVEIYNEDILQSVPSGVVSLDRELKITKMNQAAERILDLKESESIGRRHVEIFGEPVAGILDKRRTIERAEVGYVTNSGKRIWLGLNLSPLKDSTENVIGQIFVFTDLTELKAFQSQMELRERLSTLGEMSAGIAHEIRNPLAVISGYAKILSRKVDAELLPTVDAVFKEVAVIDRIITDFLSFARQTDPVPTTVDLRELIAGCVSAVAECAENVTINVRTDALPAIRADDVLLRQSITNLLQNAVESSPDGGEVTVSGSVGDCLVISVSDSGHGIPESIRGKIFLPFFTTKERGTGLGLSIVHKIVVSHGGTVEVETGGKGSTFTIRLPKDVILEH
ncbi:MAG: ATP-binding protein [Nitrospiraceae bacterium]|nr:ATP-binding protein [Nitrospiraceae bacterium]